MTQATVAAPASALSLTRRLDAVLVGLSNQDLSWTDVRLAAWLEPVREWGVTPVAALKAALQSIARVSAPGVEDLVAQLERMRTLTVRQEFEEILASVDWQFPARSERNVTVLREWILVASESGAVMADLAERHGVTRERVRQLMDRMTTGLIQSGVWTPAADALMAFIAGQAPLGLERSRRDPGLVDRLGEGMSLLGFLRWRQALDKPLLELVLEDISPLIPCKVIATDAQRALLRETFTPVRALVRRRGVFQVPDVARTLGVSDQTLIDRLSMDPQFELLMSQGAWAWFGSVETSRFAREARAVLAVLPQGRGLTIDELVDAMLRDAEHCSIAGDQAIPRGLAEGLCASLDDVEVIDGRLRLRGDLVASRQRYLTERERALYDLMSRHEGVMGRQAIGAAFEGHPQIAADSVLALLRFWSGLVRLQRGVFRLVGWDASEPALRRATEDTCQPAGARSVLQVDQQAEELVFEHTVRSSAFTVKRIHVPTGCCSWIVATGLRRFRSDQVDGLVLGTGIEANGQVRLRRIDEVFRHLGVAEGDPVRVTVRRNGTLSVERLPG